MNLIQPLLIVFVLFECTSNSLSPTVDFGFQGESYSGKLPSSNRNQPYNSIIITTKDEPNTDFNSHKVGEGQSVGFKVLEKRFPSTDLLDTHNSRPFGSYTRYYNHTWWNTVQEELYEMLSSKVNCTEEPYTCFGNKTVNINEDEGLCGCDSFCEVYGYCCIDKAATITNYDIRVQNRLQCETLYSDYYQSVDIYMIGGCLPSMKETFEEKLCHRKVEEGSYEVSLDIPVHSLATNFTYVNYYCALCNNDAESLLQIDLTHKCEIHSPVDGDLNTILSKFLMEAKYIPGERKYVQKIKVENEEKSEGQKESLNVTFYEDFAPVSPKEQTCFVKVRQYEDLSYSPELYGLKTCVRREFISNTSSYMAQEVNSCNSSWPVLSDFEKCHAYSLKIYDESRNIFYKNPHCAKCNFAVLSADKFSCKGALYVRGLPPSPRIPVLFKFPSNSPRKYTEKNTFLSLTKNRCKKIVCGVGRILNKGKCIKNKSENYVRNVTENSSLINKTCLTVEETNFTINDNDSVYVFSSDKLLEKGDYELVNYSVILVCAQDDLCYKENFTIDYNYYITFVVISISISCLAFHILLYFRHSRLRTWHGRNLLCFCFSLFTAQLLFLTGTTVTENSVFCVFMAVCMHYFWLTCFFCMNILRFDMWRTFKRKFSLNLNTGKVFLLYNLYSWGVPFIIVMISLVLDLVGENIKFKPNYAVKEEKICWISNKIGSVCLYLLPIAIIIIENLILFPITSFNIYSKTEEAQFAKVKSESVKTVKVEEFSEEGKQALKNKGREEKNDKIRFVLHLKLAILQGLTWIFVLLITFINSDVLWNIFTVLNCLQVAYIVLCFDIEKWLLSSIWRKLSGITSRSMNSQDTETTTCEKGNSDGFKKCSSENVSGDSGIQSLGEKTSFSKGSDNQIFFEATRL